MNRIYLGHMLKMVFGGLKELWMWCGTLLIPAFVCINKYGLNLNITEQIERFCQQNGFPVIEKL